MRRVCLSISQVGSQVGGGRWEASLADCDKCDKDMCKICFMCLIIAFYGPWGLTQQKHTHRHTHLWGREFQNVEMLKCRPATASSAPAGCQVFKYFTHFDNAKNVFNYNLIFLTARLQPELKQRNLKKMKKNQLKLCEGY